MLTVFLILAIAALVAALAAAATGKVPLWVAVVFLAILEVVRALPPGR